LMYMETIKEKPGVTREDPNVLIVQPNKQMWQLWSQLALVQEKLQNL
jgi:hypothetical protein